jgi:cell division protein FtsL
MLRWLNGFLIAATLCGAFALYALNYDTRALEAKVQAAERVVDRAESDIQVLTVERAHLAAPDRIERLAREQGLGPMTPAQYRTLPATAGTAREER